ncbi:MAG: hypothetical protein K8M05_25595 [Deltaproteobacteria bacterium]|nr:hypothetical protein [Kofleriaceae bacterium]
MRGWLVICAVCAGCYTGARATRDINAAWRGRTATELQARWGTGTVAAMADGGATVTWWRTSRSYTLPAASLSGEGDLAVGPDGVEGRFDGAVGWRPGQVYRTRHDLVATVDAAGRIVDVVGPTLYLGKGPPPGANLRWGTIFGLHAGAGALDDATSPLPSLGLYIGGMIGPRLGLVGSYAFVNGTSDDGAAMGHSWSFGVQYWPAARVWLRAAPAMVLTLEPGLDDPSLQPGLATGASYALVRGRVFVLDLRVDAIAATASTFGTVGIGVNVN